MTKNEFLDHIGALMLASSKARERARRRAMHRSSIDPMFRPAHAETEGHRAAVEAFTQGLPIMACRRDAQLYIACVTNGFAYGLVTGEDLKRHLYAAQLQLAAFSGAPADPEPPISRAKPSFTGGH